MVQTAQPLSDLPASTLNVQGGTVRSTAPLSGGGGRLFSVSLATAAGASFVSLATVAGVSLSNGLSTAASNTIRIELDSTGPNVSLLIRLTINGFEFCLLNPLPSKSVHVAFYLIPLPSGQRRCRSA